MQITEEKFGNGIGALTFHPESGIDRARLELAFPLEMPAGHALTFTRNEKGAITVYPAPIPGAVIEDDGKDRKGMVTEKQLDQMLLKTVQEKAVELSVPFGENDTKAVIIGKILRGQEINRELEKLSDAELSARAKDFKLPVVAKEERLKLQFRVHQAMQAK